MRIVVNGSTHETDAADVEGALESMGFDAAPLATALNGEFVPASARKDTLLSEGDRLEVLVPMQGG